MTSSKIEWWRSNFFFVKNGLRPFFYQTIDYKLYSKNFCPKVSLLVPWFFPVFNILKVYQLITDHYHATNINKGSLWRRMSSICPIVGQWTLIVKPPALFHIRYFSLYDPPLYNVSLLLCFVIGLQILKAFYARHRFTPLKNAIASHSQGTFSLYVKHFDVSLT